MRMARPAQHPDVRARAEHLFLGRLHDDNFDFRMLKPHPLHDVGQLNIYAQIIGIEFQLIAVKQPALFVHIHDQVGNVTFIFNAPMPVL